MSGRQRKTVEQRAEAQRRQRATAASLPLKVSRPRRPVKPSKVEELFQALEMTADTLEWAVENEASAKKIMAFDDRTWLAICLAIGYGDVPRSEALRLAGRLRMWHILHGLKYFQEWDVLIAALSDDEIVTRIRIDVAAARETLDL